MDVHDPATRSKNMRAIATQDTAIEKRVAHVLNLLELAFHTQDASLAGRPDFVIPAYRSIIFTHGCFWHRHHCHLFKPPATRTDFWLKKIASNVLRDKRNIASLQQDGWRVMVIWECALRGRTKLSDSALYDRLDEWLCAGAPGAVIDAHGFNSRADE